MAFDMSIENALAPTTEKSHHLLYLRDFRTQQCPLFLQHKCTQHRPYTCFHWHFQNQKRRRVMRREDGTFNYGASDYCASYNEATGVCPHGDECGALHKPASDVERKYHLRFYKTSTCIYETDSKGHCVRNGSHCPYAHGASDLRQPVFDVRELHAFQFERQRSLSGNSQSGDQPAAEQPCSIPAARCIEILEREMSLSTIDSVWNDIVYVLLNYKTEMCSKPPRLCRQGYACPYSHNQKDRRRPPLAYRYRSTPCPNVKHGDEWGDPGLCRQEDICQYCHTRTEQQFHHEIFKSTKCNDMLQTGFCPRGPFCAFAHVPEEITIARTGLMNLFSSSNLAQYIKNPAQTAVLMGTLDHSVGPASGPAPASAPASAPNAGNKCDTNNNQSAAQATSNGHCMTANQPPTAAAAAVQCPSKFAAPLPGSCFAPSNSIPEPAATTAGSAIAWQLGRSRLNSINEEQLCANMMGLVAARNAAATASAAPDFLPDPNANVNGVMRLLPVATRRCVSGAFDAEEQRALAMAARPPGPLTQLGAAEAPQAAYDGGAPMARTLTQLGDGSYVQQYAMRPRHCSSPAYLRQLSAGTNGHSSMPITASPSALAALGAPFPTTAERRGSREFQFQALASTGDTVESVIGSALEDPSDLRVGELSLGELDSDPRLHPAAMAGHRASLPDASVCMPPERERRGSALENGMRLPPFLMHQAAFGNLHPAGPAPPEPFPARTFCSEYDNFSRRASDERSQMEFGPGMFDGKHISTDELLRIQEQRIFATHDDGEAMRSRGCEWS